MSGSILATELPVFTQYYALFLWSSQRAEGFPRTVRPTLGHRFQELLVTGLEQLLELRYSRDRVPLFSKFNLTLEKLRILSRALKDRRVLSIKQYEHFNRELDAVGRQTGGWMKANAQRGRDAGKSPGASRSVSVAR